MTELPSDKAFRDLMSANFSDEEAVAFSDLKALPPGGSADSTPKDDHEQKVSDSIIAREQIMPVVRLYVHLGKQIPLSRIYYRAKERCGELDISIEEVRAMVDSLVPEAEADLVARRDSHNE